MKAIVLVALACSVILCSCAAQPTATPIPTATPAPTNTPVPSHTATRAPTLTPLPTITPVTIYVVQAGDTLSGIAVKFDSSVEAIAAANGITNVGLIVIGQKLVVP
jgi:LysM repeat protein